jgi:hypothetical protein
MRGTTTRQATMLSTLTSDSVIPLDHPIHVIGAAGELLQDAEGVGAGVAVIAHPPTLAPRR